jgi:chromosomal replication initiation ATPase DnaA
MQEAWQQASENLEKVLSERDFNTLIRPVRYSHHDNDAVYLSVPTSFFKEWLE